MIDMKQWIKGNESFKRHGHVDKHGNIIIGYGRDIGTTGLSKDEADLLFDNDFDRCHKALSHYRWYFIQPYHVQAALMDMCFSMGIENLLSFKKMIQDLFDRNYAKAALEALHSSWGIKNVNRAKQVALMMREEI